MSEQRSPLLAPNQHESLFAPRTLLAIGIFGLFALKAILPYFQAVPSGTAANLILTSDEVLKAALFLVIGYYFGTSQNSQKKDEALAAAASAPVTVNTTGPAVAGGIDVGSGDASNVLLQPGDKVEVAAADKDDIKPDPDDGDLPAEQRVEPPK